MDEAMKRSIKAALLSGLIFPGLGHMVLKHYVTGSVLILSTLAALSVIVTEVTSMAFDVVDRINSGEIPADAAAITDAVSQSTQGAQSSLTNIATVVVVACWLIGIIDSYRLGMRKDR